MDYHKKYLKYKTKYLLLREQIGGGISEESGEIWNNINKAAYKITLARSDIEFCTGTNNYTDFWNKLSEILVLKKNTIYSFDTVLLNKIDAKLLNKITTSKPFIHVYKESDKKWKFYVNENINIWLTTDITDPHKKLTDRQERLRILNNKDLNLIDYDMFMNIVRENGQVMFNNKPNSKINVVCNRQQICNNNDNIKQILAQVTNKENEKQFMKPEFLNQRAMCEQHFILYDSKQMKKYLHDKAMKCEMYYIIDPFIIHNEEMKSVHLDPYCKIK